MKPEHPTLDGSTLYRCMLVGLDDKTARECKNAIRPLEAVVVPEVRDACKKMSDVLPLIVVLDENADAHPELVELAGACGAELVTIRRPLDTNAFGHQILDALRKGEARRVAR
ncbi:MAG: hypothetical protein KF819_21500 [Labilithrix sp.]|nr:hypothetical protein [Labilithrix sp.]